jgi:hypothetical protein
MDTRPHVHEVRCEGCREATPSHDIVSYGSKQGEYRHLCGQCFNGEVARAGGLEGFEHPTFRPVGLTDCAGQIHNFFFRIRLLGTGVALDAFELRAGNPAGYQFQIIGNPEEDVLALFGRLVERIRRALSMKHLVDSELGVQIANQVVRGTIAWDGANDGRLPLLVIDGQEIAWDEFGRMLMSFEGWRFRLNIVDKGEEL